MGHAKDEVQQSRSGTMRVAGICIILTTIIAACDGQPPAGFGPQAGSTTTETKPVPEIGAFGFDESGMDLSVKPGDDFFAYANGTWVKNNPVPSSETRWGSFNELQKNNNKALRAILEKAASEKNEKGSVEQLIGDYYFSLMDSNRRDKAGVEPIKKYLQKIDDLKFPDGIAHIVAELHNDGIPALFSFGVEQDLKDNSRNVIYTGQGGTGLPSKSYYTKTDDDSKKIQQKYKDFIDGMFMSVFEKEENMGWSQTVYKFELSLAEASMSRVELRNYFAQYNPMSVEELNKSTGKFHINAYMEMRGISGVDTLIVSQPEFMKNFQKLINDFGPNDWKRYLKWCVIRSSSGSLTTGLEQLAFNFYGKVLGGQKEMKPKWKSAIEEISQSAIDEALGHAFVNENFSPESKVKVNEMVDNIMAVYKERIDNLEWMSDETKAKAQEKLASFTRKLGFPDEWTDYSSLEITRNDYFQNKINMRRFQIAKNTKKLNAPIDRGEWAMAPHIVNAYYNPLLNEIVFPAGIMQPPFFDPKKEDAVNYARMGAVIGHELTHGFDDQGAQFTAQGEFKNWWTEKDQLQFAARTQKLVDQFNDYEALPGLNVNGRLTLGENIADFGGLTIAYYAYQKSLEGKTKTTINGFTNEQRFFISFAQIWKTNYTDGAMKMQVNTNPHAPGRFRVLGPLSNMPEFFEAFDVKEGSPMRQSPDKISVIW